MKKYKLIIKLLSETLPGSGEGLGANIDLDVVLDNLGIPYLPAKRIKGVLRDALQDTIEMLAQSSINFSNKNNSSEILGKAGQSNSSNFYLSNLYLSEYHEAKEWLNFLKNQYSNIFSKDVYENYFTEIRHQSTINDDGVTKDGSLRTFRVLRKGLTFEGIIEMAEEDVKIIALACANIRNIGMMRNRGFGLINCALFDIEGNNITEPALNELGELCIA